LRTALFNYLFARKYDGIFILRIEDTDQARFVPGAMEYIIEALNWCGLPYDEGPLKGGSFAPYLQSERKTLYRQYADQLLESGHAYLAFDTPEEIEQLRKQAESEGRTFQYDGSVRNRLRNSLAMGTAETEKLIRTGVPHVIRFKMPENREVLISDLIRGEVSFQTSLLDDKVLFKADGLPTYHLANVTDDFLMEITHVIRGEEWLSSLPLHVLLYQALGWEKKMPRFAHLPLILKPGGQGKLSKRDGDKMGFPVFPLQWKDPFTGEISSGYRESGYLPDAVVNMLAFLGWNPGGEQEIYSLDELVRAFSLERAGKAGARFDPEKAKWFNQQYLREKTVLELSQPLLQKLNREGIKADTSYVEKAVELVKDRLTFLHENDLWEQTFFFFVRPEKYAGDSVKKAWKEDTPELIENITSRLESLSVFRAAEIEESIKRFAEETGTGMGKIMNPLRLLLVGGPYGPHLTDIMALLGREEVRYRTRNGILKLGIK
jgi:glutamyl-tRNA synthetase